MDKYAVDKIVARYFITADRNFHHHPDCRIGIRGLRKIFCSCGLLHDLKHLDHAFAKLLYPRYHDDLNLQEFGIKGKKAALPIYTGESINRLSFKDIKSKHDEYRAIIKFIFPRKTDCPAVFKRLEEWLKAELEKPV